MKDFNKAYLGEAMRKEINRGLDIAELEEAINSIRSQAAIMGININVGPCKMLEKLSPMDFFRYVLTVRDQEKLSYNKTASVFDVKAATLKSWAAKLGFSKYKKRELDIKALHEDMVKYPNDIYRNRGHRLGVSASAICRALKRLGK